MGRACYLGKRYGMLTVLERGSEAYSVNIKEG
jgi:hypothetical protein